jgi:hypothetical protein
VEKLVDSIDILRRAIQNGFDDMRKELIKIRKELEESNIKPLQIDGITNTFNEEFKRYKEEMNREIGKVKED